MTKQKTMLVVIAMIFKVLRKQKWMGIGKLCTHLHLHLHPAPSTSIQLHLPPRSSTHLHLSHFNLHLALCNTLNVIRTKILHVIGQFPQFWAKNSKYLGDVDSRSGLRFFKFRPQNLFLGKLGLKKWKMSILLEN